MMATSRWSLALGALLAAGCLLSAIGQNATPRLSDERVVMTTDFGDIELAFYPEIAPITVAHILKLFQLGGYNTNHIFRVHEGFVLQVADVSFGRIVPLSAPLEEEEAKNVPLEISPDVRHVPGILSMARQDDPNSGKSSFSMLLGEAAHLDGQYTIFGEVTQGFDAMRAIEGLNYTETGIFRIPTQRVGIHSTYWYTTDGRCGVGPNAANADDNN